MNILDVLRNTFNPPVDNTNEKKSYNYQSVSDLRVIDRVVAVSQSGEATDKYERSYLVNVSRKFYRDNPIYKSLIDNAVHYSVGSGFTVQATTKDKEWNDKAEKLWKDWWNRPEVSGLLSGPKVEQMIAREFFLSGDLGIIKLGNGRIQVVESEQIGTGALGTGIDTDEYGTPTKFHIAQYNDYGMPQYESAQEYNAEDIIFIVDRQRPSSLRGVPPCQQAFSILSSIEQIQKNEVKAWETLSRLALSITRNDASLDMPDPYGNTTTDTTTDADIEERPRIQLFDTAMIFNAAPGEKIEGIPRNIPGSDFEKILKAFVRLTGIPLAVPMEVILLCWNDSNYSQSRAVLQSTYEVFKNWQQFFEDHLYSVLYKWKISEWIRTKQLDPNEEWDKHYWIGPSFPWIDPQKESQAMQTNLELGLTTYGTMCNSMHMEKDDVISARKKEIADAINTAKQIKEQTGVDVPYQYFCGLATPSTIQPLEPVDNGENKDESNI